MTTIKINTQMTEKEENAVWLNHHPDFKMINDNTGMIGDYAIIEFDERDPQNFDDEKERAEEICEQYTNIEIMQALALMHYKGDHELYRLPRYIEEFNKMGDYDRPMDFYPFVKNDDDMREYLYVGWIPNNKDNVMQEINEHIESLRGYCDYTRIGALIWNY